MIPKCDHCGRPGEPYTYRGIQFDGLHAMEGEQLCSSCLDRAHQEYINRPVGPLQIPGWQYIEVISGPGRYKDWQQIKESIKKARKRK